MPSFIAPPAASVGSSQWSATGMPNVRAYSSAVRMRCALTTGLAVVAHGHRAGGDHLAEFGERFAALADRDRADRIDARRVRERRLPDDESDRGLIVRDGIGVRHRAHRGESAGRRGPRARRDRLDLFSARLAQMAVHVDESRRDNAPSAIDGLEVVAARRLVADARTDRFDLLADDEHVGNLIKVL